MARAARVVPAGVPHHIAQRGNNRQNVFLADEDRLFYLECLREDCRRHRVGVLGYCLMANHVHLVAVLARSDSLSRALQRSHSRHAQRFNRLYARTGHLWQNRFFSCSLGPDHLLVALAYVDLNPVRAGLTGQAERYPWSSARAHLERADRFQLVDWSLWDEVHGSQDWSEQLNRPRSEDEQPRIRAATHSGLPLGNAGFVAELERRVGRSLKPGRPGRKPRAAAAVA